MLRASGMARLEANSADFRSIQEHESASLRTSL